MIHSYIQTYAHNKRYDIYIYIYFFIYIHAYIHYVCIITHLHYVIYII